MQKAVLTLYALSILLPGWFLSGCDVLTNEPANDSSDSLSYYCPMHPEVQQTGPGICEKCGGMELVLKDAENYLDAVLEPVSSKVLSKITLVNPEYRIVPVGVEATGYIDYDDHGKYDISSRYTGRVDKLYIKYNYQQVKKGEVVFEIYSSDLVTAQENFIYLLKTALYEKALIEAARQKLILLQLTKQQIEEIETTKKIIAAIPVYSRFDGRVREVIDPDMSPGQMTDIQKSSLLSVREGMYVERGDILFNILDPKKAVVMLKIKSTDISKVHKGQQVILIAESDPDKTINGNIDFIEPVFKSNEKTLMVRVNINNSSQEHKIGSLVKATILSDSLETLWVPSSAVVDLGKQKIVWVWDNGNFKARRIETGIVKDSMVEIADGLTENDQVASEAHYLTDSEGFIRISDDE